MKIAVLAVIATLATPAAAFAQTAPAPGAASAATTAKFTLDTPVETIVADAKGKAALDAAVPGLTTHASYETFKGMSLRQLSSFAGDRLTPEVLAGAEKALAEVK